MDATSLVLGLCIALAFFTVATGSGLWVYLRARRAAKGRLRAITEMVLVQLVVVSGYGLVSEQVNIRNGLADNTVEEYSIVPALDPLPPYRKASVVSKRIGPLVGEIVAIEDGVPELGGGERRTVYYWNTGTWAGLSVATTCFVGALALLIAWIIRWRARRAAPGFVTNPADFVRGERRGRLRFREDQEVAMSVMGSVSPPPGAPHTMRCLEVWGGNQAVNNGVVMAGLDAWLYSRPFGGEAAGGDIHYVSSCAQGMLARVLVADVSGHGEAVAEAARSLRELMRRFMNYVDQSQLVQGLNSEFGSLAQAGGFATAVVATYLVPEDELQLCNAGHPRPLWYRARSGTWQLMGGMGGGEGAAAKIGNTPLGLVDSACYDPIRLKLAKGDLVVLYTDSLIEARDAGGRQLGEQGLLELARRMNVSDPEEMMQALLSAVSEHTGGAGGAGGAASADDVTVLILRPNGLVPRVSAGVHVKAFARMVGALVASLMPGGPEFPEPEEGMFRRLGRWANRARGAAQGSAARSGRA